MGYKVSLIKLDFPLPLTPVTHINFPKGNSTVTFFKLLPVAPLITNFFPFPFLRSFGISICFLPLKYCAVMESDFKISSQVPCAAICPP